MGYVRRQRCVLGEDETESEGGGIVVSDDFIGCASLYPTNDGGVSNDSVVPDDLLGVGGVLTPLFREEVLPPLLREDVHRKRK